ncbi:MAG TPA: hypothetical protein VES93_05340 [Ornithinibacter sp.]|nr:hypothetical protein [Ornithinibacter sp.]
MAARPGTPVGALTAASPSAIPPSTPAPNTGGIQGRVDSGVASVRAAMAGTPGRLRAVGIVSVVATLLFGLAAGQAFRSADGALGRAAANSDQLVRIQAIQTNVVQADADATNAFLVGGLEPAAQRADYTEAVASASRLIAEAAQHQPADGNALAALNQSLVAYTSQVEQARANNRQALPVGAQYLKGASADLRADALPLLTNLSEANNARVAEEFDRAARSALWLVLPGLLALAVLALSLVWLARRTRRFVNVPLAAGALVVLVTLVAGTVGLLSVKQSVDTTRDGVYAATRSTAQARIAGFDAKSNESLTLIARGSGAAFEKAWQASSAAVVREVAALGQNPASSSRAALPWDGYATVHEKIRALDDAGDWEGAVALATGSEPDTGNATFAAFDTASDEQLTALSDQTSQQLDDTGGWLPFAGVLGLLAGVIGALCAWWGVSMRLEEYR